MANGTLFALSDLHVDHPQNREFVDRVRPDSPDDWLIVCGDVADSTAGIERGLGSLRERFAKVIWVPGNHELLTHRDDSVGLRGEARYMHLVDLCRRLDVITPEDPFPVWDGIGGPARVIPLFLLYDYSFGRREGEGQAEAMRRAHEAGVVCVDEFLLHPDPFPSRENWCHDRIRRTESRLEDEGWPPLPSVLVNHFPLLEDPTRLLYHQEFAQWCGTSRTADWHRRYRASVVVYGHLHIPRTSWHDGVRFEEVSLGYPREWQRRGGPCGPRRILPGGPHA